MVSNREANVGPMDILRFSLPTTEQMSKKAFRKLAFQYHPGKSSLLNIGKIKGSNNAYPEAGKVKIWEILEGPQIDVTRSVKRTSKPEKYYLRPELAKRTKPIIWAVPD